MQVPERNRPGTSISQKSSSVLRSKSSQHKESKNHPEYKTHLKDGKGRNVNTSHGNG